MTATNGELAAQVRHALDGARQAGRPTPGRPTLVRLTGATDHAIRKVLVELAATNASAGVGSTNVGDLDGVVTPAINQTDNAHQPIAVKPAVVPHGGRFVAWTGFVFGSVMSIAANVLHAWLPGAHESPDWSPGIAPQVGATVWPIGLTLAVEALSRIQLPKGALWGLARIGGAGAVAGGSGVISYGHLCEVLLAWQYGPLAAAVGPLVLDGLMVISIGVDLDWIVSATY